MKGRTKSFKERPLILNGVDPVKFIETAKPNEIKPFMAIYFNLAKQSMDLKS
jgi:hypothetical protein